MANQSLSFPAKQAEAQLYLNTTLVASSRKLGFVRVDNLEYLGSFLASYVNNERLFIEGKDNLYLKKPFSKTNKAIRYMYSLRWKNHGGLVTGYKLSPVKLKYKTSLLKEVVTNTYY